MSSQDIVFNGNNFIDNLKLILAKQQSGYSATELISRQYLQDQMADIPVVNVDPDFFFRRFSTDTNPFINWDTLVNELVFFLSSNPVPVTKEEIEAEFLKDFKAMIGYTDGNPSGSDWALLSGNSALTDTSGFPLGVDDDLIAQYFRRSMDIFLATYPYIYPLEDHDGDPNTPDVPSARGIVGTLANADAADNFFRNWTVFLTRTAEFFDGTTNSPVVDFAAYEQVYRAFFPVEEGETEQEFLDRFQFRVRKFWKEQALENGAQSPATAWFIPSYSFDEWFEELREEFILGSTRRSTHLYTVSGTSVLGDGSVVPSSQRVLVIDRILRLLVLMIDLLQRISASQAERLSFLTKWQSAYTQLVADVPHFGAGLGQPLGSDSTEDKEARAMLNEAFGQTLEKVRARRSAVQDEAKMMQTTVSQSQDAANQQTQMATSLLQQLSTIISQIFR